MKSFYGVCFSRCPGYIEIFKLKSNMTKDERTSDNLKLCVNDFASEDDWLEMNCFLSSCRVSYDDFIILKKWQLEKFLSMEKVHKEGL